jgi:ribonuclease R
MGELDTSALVGALEKRAPRPLTIAELARFLRLEHYDRRAMQAVLEAEVEARRVRRIGKTRYQWLPPAQRRAPRAPSAKRLEGRYARVRGGFGFVEIPGRARDVLIPQGEEGGAMHGDRVVVEMVRGDQRGRRATGRVTAVVERAREFVVGTLERHGRRWLLMPEDELLPPVELLGDETPDPGEEGRVGLARLTRSPSGARPAGGLLERILGDPDDPEVQFLVIAYEYGLRVLFPPEVLAEAERCQRGLGGDEDLERLDLRHLPFVTIDGETARDFDDAVAVEALPRSRTRLLVAIADVSHYVRPGTALDEEAARRGTSVYFPDRAIPMLPEALSNDLCSLRPDEDRLAVVADIVVDRHGGRESARFHRCRIRSRARLTYTQVAAVISDTDTPDIQAQRAALGSLVDDLKRMHALMRLLNRVRLEAGSLDLDLPESLVDLSEEGRSIGLRLFRRNDAHRIIEEFMLQANCAVAEFLRAARLPFPYRIHEPPSEEAIEELNEALGPFGVAVRWKHEVEPADVQRALERIAGHRLSRVLSRLVLRSLTQARYSTDNAGHFGLAFPVYCHFTSPIRRYPDLLVHRQLLRLLDGGAETARAEAEAVARASLHSSFLERQAMEAERAMLDLRKAEFMLGHLLEPMPATVVSVARFGAFVELDDYPVEGLLREEAFPRQGRPRPRRRHFQLGDRVVVEATNASLRQRRVDFALVD